MLSSAVLEVIPSKTLSSVGVAEICVVEAAANGCKKPPAFASLISLSAVGSTIVRVVSKSSARPSNVTDLERLIVVESTVVVVP